jgi:hypothetical protein
VVTERDVVAAREPEFDTDVVARFVDDDVRYFSRRICTYLTCLVILQLEEREFDEVCRDCLVRY